MKQPRFTDKRPEKIRKLSVGIGTNLLGEYSDPCRTRSRVIECWKGGVQGAGPGNAIEEHYWRQLRSGPWALACWVLLFDFSKYLCVRWLAGLWMFCQRFCLIVAISNADVAAFGAPNCYSAGPVRTPRGLESVFSRFWDEFGTPFWEVFVCRGLKGVFVRACFQKVFLYIFLNLN